MKKIDSKQALLQFLRERIEAARVDTNIRGFDDVLSVFRLTDFSKQAMGIQVRGLVIVWTRTYPCLRAQKGTYHLIRIMFPVAWTCSYERQTICTAHRQATTWKALSAIRLTACSSWQIL
jgi:hypothetical protein